MDLRQDSVHVALSSKQGNKIEGVVLNRACISGFFFFFLNEGQGFNQERMSILNLLPNIGRVPPHLGITMDKERSLTNNDETI